MWTFLRASFGRFVWLWLGILIIGLVVLFAPSPFRTPANMAATPSPMLPPVLPITVLLGGMLGFFLWNQWKNRPAKPRHPSEGVIGKSGVVVDPVQAGESGTINIMGELWAAESEAMLEEGAEVRVFAVSSIDPKVLKVIPIRREA